MPLDRPTLSALRARIEDDFRTRYPGYDALPSPSLPEIASDILAGAIHELYGTAFPAVRNLLPDLSDEEDLQRWGRIQKVPERIGSVATGDVVATGTDGKTIPAGTLLQSGEGVEYLVTALATIAGGTATVSVEARLAGVDGNQVAGTVLSFVSPISGVSSSVLVDVGGLVDGTDTESLESYRERVLDAMAAPTRGGNQADWDSWVRDHPTLDVTRWWVTPPPAGMDVISVTFVLDNQTPSIQPDAAQQASMLAYLDDLKVVGSTVNVAAPIIEALYFTIQLTPDTAEVRAAVSAELTDLLDREAEPGGIILLSHIREAVSIAAGETDNDVIVPAGDALASGPSHLFVLGPITWV